MEKMSSVTKTEARKYRLLVQHSDSTTFTDRHGNLYVFDQKSDFVLANLIEERGDEVRTHACLTGKFIPCHAYAFLLHTGEVRRIDGEQDRDGNPSTAVEFASQMFAYFRSCYCFEHVVETIASVVINSNVPISLTEKKAMQFEKYLGPPLSMPVYGVCTMLFDSPFRILLCHDRTFTVLMRSMDNNTVVSTKPYIESFRLVLDIIKKMERLQWGLGTVDPAALYAVDRWLASKKEPELAPDPEPGWCPHEPG